MRRLIMELILTPKQLKEIEEKALNNYLKEKGFDITKPILRNDRMDGLGKVYETYFRQDNTPDIGGDNIECEFLQQFLDNTDKK